MSNPLSYRGPSRGDIRDVSAPQTQNYGDWKGASQAGPLGALAPVKNRQEFANTVNPGYMQAAQNSVLTPITEQLMNTVLPQVRGGAIAGGGLGGSRQQLAERGQVNNYIDRATNALAPLANQLYGQALQGDINSALQQQQLGNQRDLQTQGLNFQGQEGMRGRGLQGDLGFGRMGLDADMSNQRADISNAQMRHQAAMQAMQMQPGLVDQNLRYQNQSAGLPSSVMGRIGNARFNMGHANQFLPLNIAMQLLGGASGMGGGSNQSTFRPDPLGQLIGLGSLFAGGGGFGLF